MFPLIILFCVIKGTTPIGSTLDVQIDVDHPVSSTGNMYIGVTVDTHFILDGNFSALDLQSSRLATLTRALSPSFVRVGGTMADALVFNVSAPGYSNNTIGGQVWKRLHRLIQMADWDLIFDVNSLTRNGGGWDPTNARELLQYSQQNGYAIPGFQLGNEPDIFQREYNTTVSPEQRVKDYELFRTVLSQFPLYGNSFVLGPEVTNLDQASARDYFTRFLQAGGGKALSGIGVHHYYCPNYTITDDFFVNVTALDTLKTELDLLTSLSRHYAPELPLWFSETSSVYSQCPGTYHDREKYIDGFMWLDKLGLSALYGIQHLNRQQFFTQLINEDIDPLPDYYLTLLYKRLVQGSVFKVSTSTPTVRLYAHCANPDRYPQGSLTVYALNLGTTDVTFTFSQFNGLQLDVFILTPGDQDGLLSSYVALNGKQLIMDGDRLPPLLPETVTDTVTLPSRTFGFVVIKDANVLKCQ